MSVNILSNQTSSIVKTYGNCCLRLIFFSNCGVQEDNLPLQHKANNSFVPKHYYPICTSLYSLYLIISQPCMHSIPYIHTIFHTFFSWVLLQFLNGVKPSSTFFQVTIAIDHVTGYHSDGCNPQTLYLSRALQPVLVFCIRITVPLEVCHSSCT